MVEKTAIDPYDFLHEIDEELSPPENEDETEAWLRQLRNILNVFKDYQHPAEEALKNVIEDESPEEYLNSHSSDEVDEFFRLQGYIVGLNASIAQTHYWTQCLILDKGKGITNSTEEVPEEIQIILSDVEDKHFLSSYTMWKNAISHLMYTNYDSFILPTNGFRFLDYHDKLYANFVILTTSTVIETALERTLSDMGVENLADQNFNNLINMMASRSDVEDVEKLHLLRKVRNKLAHDITQRSEYNIPKEIERLDSHFEATFGIAVRSLDITSQILENQYNHQEGTV
jgi:hypothetical protein